MNQKIAVAVVYVAALFMAIMDTTIVNVTLPTLGRDFHTSSDGVDLVAIAFLVSLAVFIPVSGWVGDRLGGRRTLLSAIALFTVASAACGLATSLDELIVFRIIQGIGGGLMTPVGLAMLFRVFPPAERVRASSILVIPTALAPALGPVLGGLFTTDVTWRWVFYVNVPIGILALLFGAVFLGDHTQPSPGRLDIVGFVLSGLGFGALMYGLSEGPIKGWSTLDVTVTVVVGAALLVVLVARELRTDNPLVDLRLFADRLFAPTTSILVLGSIAFLGVLYLAALFFQDGLGLSALAAGLLIFPEALGVMAGSQMVTRVLYPNLGPSRVMAMGLVGVTICMGLLALVTTGTNLWLVRLDLFALGYAMSHVFIPSQAAAFATISPARTAKASAVFNAGRQLGGAVGVAVLTTVLSAVGPVHVVARHAVPNLSAYHDGFLTAAGIALVAVLLTFAVHDSDAASTIVKRHRTPEPQRQGAHALVDDPA